MQAWVSEAKEYYDSTESHPVRVQGFTYSIMAQSLAKVHLHLIFSTQRREPLLRESTREVLHDYMGGILRDLDPPLIEANSMPDHEHLLFLLSRTRSISDVVGQVKRGSSAWLKTQGDDYLRMRVALRLRGILGK